MIEVTVTLKNLAEVQAKLGEMIEETRRKVASGEIEPTEPEVEPCDCPGCRHLDPRTRRPPDHARARLARLATRATAPDPARLVGWHPQPSRAAVSPRV